jgi:hypothetical protein
MTNRELMVSDIVSRIFYVRGQKVMLDSDLASIYCVETKVLNQAVKRNFARFPEDFFFQLTTDEWESLRSQIVTLNEKPHEKTGSFGRGKFRKYLPYVFTEHGALMLSAVLQSDVAVNAGIFVVRAFVKLREFLKINKELAKKIEELEARYDEKFSMVFETIYQLIEKKNEPLNPIGFRIAGNKSSSD